MRDAKRKPGGNALGGRHGLDELNDVALRGRGRCRNGHGRSGARRLLQAPRLAAIDDMDALSAFAGSQFDRCFSSPWSKSFSSHDVLATEALAQRPESLQEACAGIAEAAASTAVASKTCDQSFLHLIPFDLHKQSADDLSLRTDHLHSIAACRVKGPRKLGKCVYKAAGILHCNIRLEPWPIGHRGLGVHRNARYKVSS